MARKTTQSTSAALSLPTATLTVVALLLTAIIPTTAIANHQTAVAAIDAPVNGAQLYRNAVIQFVDNSTAPAGCTVDEWQWRGDIASGLRNPTASFSVLGTKNVTLRVRTTCVSNHFTPDATVTFTILNNPPTASLIRTGGALTAGQTLTYSGAGSTDVDGTIATYRFFRDGVLASSQASAVYTTSFTAAGSHSVGLEVVDNDGATSSRTTQTFTIAPAALATITVTGPSSATVGSTHTYALAGADTYANPVTLAQSSLSRTFGTTAGQVETVSYTESGITGSLSVSLVAAPLASISVTGPASLKAGNSATYTLAGADQYGNAITLAAASVLHTAGTLAGVSETVSYTESGVTGSELVAILANDLASIQIGGPANVRAGREANFSVSGADQYGNAVALAVTTIPYTVGTTAGTTETVTYTESGITGNKLVTVIADNLVRIEVDGPATLKAGRSADFDVIGFDQYENSVALAAATVPHTAGKVAGEVEEVSYTEDGIIGTTTVTILEDDLASIVLTGPLSMVAGTNDTWTLAGFDQYGNAVELEDTSVPHEAGIVAGITETVTYAEAGITGLAEVLILADELASIEIDGPLEIVANTQVDYDVLGFDQYGNAVELAETKVSHTAGTLAGETETITYEEDGILGSLNVLVIADEVVRIVMTGPETVRAGREASFAVVGFDQYDNLAPLAVDSVSATAGTLAGEVETVSYTENDATGEATFTVVPDVATVLALSALPTQVNIGQPVAVTYSAEDQYGNAVAVVATATNGTLVGGVFTPNRPGIATITARADDLVATRLITVVSALRVTLEMERTSYAPHEAVMDPIRGTVTAARNDGTVLSNAFVTITITRSIALGNILRQEIVTGNTDVDGVLVFTVPPASTVASSYSVLASVDVGQNNGTASAAYAVAVV